VSSPENRQPGAQALATARPGAEALAAAVEGRVEGLRRLSGGASRETWAFEAVTSEGASPLILRRDPPSMPRPERMAREAAALRAAAAHAVPVPRVLAQGDGADGVGTPYLVMERVEGQVLPRRVLRDPALARARETLAAECGAVLARIHAIPAEAIPSLPAHDPLAELERDLARFGEPHPVLEWAVRWLGAERRPPARTTVTHGDFRNGNLIVGPEGLRAVLDWEAVHVSDPMEDLGWLCVKAWRYGSPGPVGGFGATGDLFAAYERTAGVTVDAEAVRWWQVLGTLRWGINCIELAFRHLTGGVRSLELAAIGRRASENELDLIELILDR